MMVPDNLTQEFDEFDLLTINSPTIFGSSRSWNWASFCWIRPFSIGASAVTGSFGPRDDRTQGRRNGSGPANQARYRRPAITGRRSRHTREPASIERCHCDREFSIASRSFHREPDGEETEAEIGLVARPNHGRGSRAHTFSENRGAVRDPDRLLRLVGQVADRSSCPSAPTSASWRRCWKRSTEATLTDSHLRRTSRYFDACCFLPETSTTC